MTAVGRLLTVLFGVVFPGMTAAVAQDVGSAKDAPVISVDDGNLAADSLRTFPPVLFFSVPAAPELPSLLHADVPLTQEERAMAADLAVHASVMASVARNLGFVPMVDIIATTGWMPFANPFAVPYGYVPMGNASNPFIIAKIPGWNPEPDKYSPDAIPQCIRLEYDFATGTYRQVMVDWNEYMKQISKLPANIRTDPVPAIPVTPVERAMRQ